MPKYEVTLPSGKYHVDTGSDQVSEQDLIRHIISQDPKAAMTPTPKAPGLMDKLGYAREAATEGATSGLRKAFEAAGRLDVANTGMGHKTPEQAASRADTYAKALIPQTATGQAIMGATLPLSFLRPVTMAGRLGLTAGNAAAGAGAGAGANYLQDKSMLKGAGEGMAAGTLASAVPALSGAIARRTPGISNLIRSGDATKLGGLAEQALPGAGFRGTQGFQENILGGGLDRSAGAASDRVKGLLDAQAGQATLTRSNAPTLFAAIPQELRRTYGTRLTPSQGMHALSNVQDPVARRAATEEFRTFLNDIDTMRGTPGQSNALWDAHQRMYSQTSALGDLGTAGTRQGLKTEFDMGRAAGALNKDQGSYNGRLKDLADVTGSTLRRGAPAGYQDVPSTTLNEAIHPGMSAGTTGKIHGFLATSRKLINPSYAGKPPLDVTPAGRSIGDVVFPAMTEEGNPVRDTATGVAEDAETKASRLKKVLNGEVNPERQGRLGSY